MVNKFEKLSETLNVDFDEVILDDIPPKKQIVPVESNPIITQDLSEEDNEAEKQDFHHSRKMLREVIDLGKEALEGIKDVASQSDEPRRFEVVRISIKNISDSIKTLYELHATRKRVREGRIEQPTERSNINVDKAVFVGTGADFLSHIKQKQQEKTIDHA